MASKKLYHRRLVAEADAKACWICFRPSTTVLITPENDDWFHVCPGHLKDRKFAIPQDEEDLEEKKRKEELDKEIEAVKKEYEEKMQKKRERRKGKDADKDDKKASKKEEKKEDEEDEKQKDAKLNELEEKKDEPKKGSDGPRIFELHKDFQQMRMQKKREADKRRRDAENSRKNVETLKSAGGFPSVPSGTI